MPIIDHPTIKYDNLNDAFPYYESAKVVKCDSCRSLCHHTGHDPGDAADRARKLGWTTKRGATITAPRLWVCPECIE